MKRRFLWFPTARLANSSVRAALSALLTGLLLLLILIGALNTMTFDVLAEAAPTDTPAAPPANEISQQPISSTLSTTSTTNVITAATTTLYLPFVTRRYPPPPNRFGSETEVLAQPNIIRTAQAGAGWIRYPAFNWATIEPTRTHPATYHWEAVNEAGFQLASAKGIQIIATIKFTPSWAQKVPGWSCGPVAQDSLDEYVQFVQAIVSRYSLPPYNIKYWEFGNEIDVDPVHIEQHSIIGCWGDETDAYYGGGYYAEMLKRVYPAIKAIDPKAQVLIGGLLLDCDPTNTPPPNKNCDSAKFFEGILRNQGADYFDYVSFHAYPPYFMGKIMDTNYPNWKPRGGVLMGKINFIHEVMDKYNVNKPLMLTETSLTCPEWSDCYPGGAEFEDAQADYVVWSFVRSLASQVETIIWFTIEGPNWRNTGLYNIDTPKPAYLAYRFMIQEIGPAVYMRQVSDYPELLTYEFDRADRRIWVMWAPDEADHPITLPAGWQAVYDRFGNPLLPTAGQITVNNPVYVEFTP